MNWNWLPWKYVVRRVARAHGFLDPINLLAQLHKFAQPSEVMEPLELLRAGVVFHARGLMNTKAIQHNLDWVWPYWVERQFNPADPSFVPRAFSMSHINLTHRNWTAVGQPDCQSLPIVDPRGLLTPFYDGWSLDCWLRTDSGDWLFPSKMKTCDQQLVMEDNNVAIRTDFEHNGLALSMDVRMEPTETGPVCRLTCRGSMPEPGAMIITMRPYNPEGVSFIHDLSFTDRRLAWKVNDETCIHFEHVPEGHCLSTYKKGDVRLFLPADTSEQEIHDDVGMATGAATYHLKANEARELSVDIDLTKDPEVDVQANDTGPSWEAALSDLCTLEIPDADFQNLYDIHMRSLILHSPDEVYPGPYTYKRFWFRDAAYILDAMLAMGMTDRSRRVLDRFPSRQNRKGYFISQEGEWDANGEALWIMNRYLHLTNQEPPKAWREAIVAGANWIENKRLPSDGGHLHDGLLPPGFSAEHLGTNDYYYWDDFWCVAGLHAASDMTRHWDEGAADTFTDMADRFMGDIETSIRCAREGGELDGIPASPYRRMDAGAVGSIAVGYPLQLWDKNDQRVLDTVEFLMHNSSFRGAFFQDMIHSGMNMYLTLHMAQILLRADDTRYRKLIRTVADLASPTGQWPEAIHPRTDGGCMGDGQHIWAAAEWMLMMRALFVREEDDRLVVCSGLFPEWLQDGAHLEFGPTLTRFGKVTVKADVSHETIRVSWDADWHGQPPALEIALPGAEPTTVDPASTSEWELELDDVDTAAQ